MEHINITGNNNGKHFYIDLTFKDDNSINFFFSLSEKELPYSFLYVINKILVVNKLDCYGTKGVNCNYTFQRLKRVS